MQKEKTVLVIFGGASPEHDVSCESAAALIPAISGNAYNVLVVGITKTGGWLLTEAPAEDIADAESWLSHPGNRKAVLSPDREHHGLLIEQEDGWRLVPVDCVFPIIHGETGEDGSIQGLLELSGIPYVGSGVCASSCGMDKSVSMMYADVCGVRRPLFFACEHEEYIHAPERTAEEIKEFFSRELGRIYPLFVKPASTGSSVGISKVSTDEDLASALALAAQYPGRLIVEENIEGRELKVAVRGCGDTAEAAEICEIKVVDNAFNSFELKYKGTGSHKKIPADIPAEKASEMKAMAIALYKKFGCRGFARVDFFLKEDGEIVFNEINTVPGFSEHSIYSLMFAESGVSYGELVNSMIGEALASANG